MTCKCGARNMNGYVHCPLGDALLHSPTLREKMGQRKGHRGLPGVNTSAFCQFFQKVRLDADFGMSSHHDLH